MLSLLNFFFIVNFVLLVNFVNSADFALQINEIMFDPEGNDSGYEWIEVINRSNQVIYIKTGRAGWRFYDGANHLFNEPAISVEPNEIFVIAQDKNKFLERYPGFTNKIIAANFILKNDQGIIQIFDENRNLLSSAIYNKNCGGNNNGYSIVIENNNCFENKIKNGSPGSLAVNLVDSSLDNKQNQNNSPKTFSSNVALDQNFSFLATSVNSKDSNATPLNTKKNVNDSMSMFNNNTNASSVAYAFDSNANNDFNKNNFLDNQRFPETSDSVFDLKLVISEFLPDPDGNDKGKEFIELYNEGESVIDFHQLNIYLMVNNKKVYLTGQIPPRGYFVVFNQANNFSIRNNGEIIKLYVNNDAIFSISYTGKAQKGKSLSRLANNQWSFTLPTPGRSNIFTSTHSESFIVDDNLTNNDIKTNIHSNEIDTTTNHFNTFTSSIQQANVLGVNKSFNLIFLASAIILIIATSIIVVKYL